MKGDVCSDRRATPFAGSLRARLPRSGLTCSTTSLHSKRGRAQMPPQSRSPHAGSIGLGFRCPTTRCSARFSGRSQRRRVLSDDRRCLDRPVHGERREGRDVLRCNPKVSPACA